MFVICCCCCFYQFSQSSKVCVVVSLPNAQNQMNFLEEINSLRNLFEKIKNCNNFEIITQIRLDTRQVDKLYETFEFSKTKVVKESS